MTPVSEQDISDAYTYLLGRLLVTRQQQLDFREGFKWNELVHRKPGEVDWPNPNLDVAYSEAWVAVDEHSCLLVQVPGAGSLRGFVERNAIALLSNLSKPPLDPTAQGAR